MQMSSFDLKLVMLAKQLPEDEDREETAGSRSASAMVAAPPPPHPPPQNFRGDQKISDQNNWG